jgi:thymidine phosphorylase
MEATADPLKLKYLGIDTLNEHVVYMLKDCHICLSEGFESLSRVLVTVNNHSIIATLNIIKEGILKEGEASLSECAWRNLKVKEGDKIYFSHLPLVNSMHAVRSKMYRKSLSENDFQSILKDIVDEKYSNIEVAAFVTACAGDNLNENEIISLTKAMINVGQKLNWNKELVLDKHCVGGLPGNRTTPIVVAIVAAAGYTIPKTSSRAITSPAGTADTIETMTPVNLSLEQIKEVIKKENGCFVWGGNVKLSPADDIIIRIERALDVDSEGQMIASVLSKKVAAGSTHVVIDIPVGKTAKVRTEQDAEKLKYYFKVVGRAIGLKVKVLITDGSQPIGRGIGPALEAMDVLSVLRNEANAPQDLKERALQIAGAVIDLAINSTKGKGEIIAREILESGKALTKFMAICQAQGGFTEPAYAKYKYEVRATSVGTVTEIDNRRIAKLAKLAGAPKDHAAGILLNTMVNAKVGKDDLLFTIYTHHNGILNYALEYLKAEKNIITIQ